jgi:hypothetical protein
MRELLVGQAVFNIAQPTPTPPSNSSNSAQCKRAGRKGRKGARPIRCVIKIAQTRFAPGCKRIMPGVTAIPVRGRFCGGMQCWIVSCSSKIKRRPHSRGKVADTIAAS